MDTEAAKWFATLGVGGVLAAMIFYYFRLDRARCEETIKGYNDGLKVMSETLLQVVKDNTSAVTVNTQTVAALHRRLDEERTIQSLQDQVQNLAHLMAAKDASPTKAKS